jgi:hypothetical protein
LSKAIDAGQVLPLDYMLKVLSDPNAGIQRRDPMAIAAAPYLHPRLVQQAVFDPTRMTQKELDAAIEAVEKIIPDEYKVIEGRKG